MSENSGKGLNLRNTFWIGLIVLVLTALVWSVLALLDQEKGARSTDSLSAFLSSSPSDHFSRVEKGRSLSFPEDHAAHPSFRQEWWYFTGNLNASNGDDLFGYQLTFFRFANAPHQLDLASDWQTDSTWMAHFTLTDVSGDQFFYADDFSRGAIDLAGSQASPFSVWVNSWSVTETGNSCDGCLSARVQAKVGENEIDLLIDSKSPPILQGDRGYSEKNNDGTIASYYYSYPSMETSGTLKINGKSHSVVGTTWMDREWSSAILAKGQSGWDWFALHLNEDTSLMVFQVRDANTASYKTAHLMRRGGNNTLIEDQHIAMTPVKWWKSPETRSKYPTHWKLVSTDPEAEFALEISPQIQDQELDLVFRYYEGAVFVTGTAVGMRVSGQGYMELTGYEGKE